MNDEKGRYEHSTFGVVTPSAMESRARLSISCMSAGASGGKDIRSPKASLAAIASKRWTSAMCGRCVGSSRQHSSINGKQLGCSTAESVTTARTTRPKANTSTPTLAGDRAHNSGAAQWTVPPLNWARLVRSTDKPKSSNLALRKWPQVQPSRKMFESFRSPWTIFGCWLWRKARAALTSFKHCTLNNVATPALAERARASDHVATP